MCISVSIHFAPATSTLGIELFIAESSNKVISYANKFILEDVIVWSLNYPELYLRECMSYVCMKHGLVMNDCIGDDMTTCVRSMLACRVTQSLSLLQSAY